MLALYPAASFEVLGLGLGRLPAVADQPQMEAEGWNPRTRAAPLSRLLEGSGSAKYRYECAIAGCALVLSCPDSDMFTPTNARCTASRALFLAPQHALPCRCPAGLGACRSAGTSTPYLLQSHRDAL